MPSPERRARLGHLAERLARPVGLVLSLILLIVVLRQAREADWSVLARSTRLSGAFWLTFCAYYFLSPLTEWAIYSRLWGFDWKAFPALLRKLVSNELLLDYLGDVQFLAWAQSRATGAIRPFAAVKDITVISALTGNLVTMILTALAWPYLADALPGVSLRAVLVAFSAIIALASVVLLLGRRIFSHGPRTLLAIAAVLVLRTLTSLGLAAVLWHMLLPQSSLTSLFLLATFRVIVSRLPLVPNKELLFAGLAVIALGRTAQASVAISMVASLALLCHVAVGSVLALSHIGRHGLRRARTARAER